MPGSKLELGASSFEEIVTKHLLVSNTAGVSLLSGTVADGRVEET
jgi:hypothetical protein